MNTPGSDICASFLAEASNVIFNKEKQMKLSLICFLAKGHLLIEDVPGVGKTTFVKTFAKLLGLRLGRVQFTNDLLPSDILGTSIFDKDEKIFRFHPGPIFSEVVLIDELNRATPKTQSALLQAMEERQVTIDGRTYDLPANFFLAATQNPRHQIGTFPLPESQLDRFTMRIKLGFPDAEAEKKLLLSSDKGIRIAALKTMIDEKDLVKIRAQIKDIHVSDDVVSYTQRLLQASRHSRKDIIPLSPRSGISLMMTARANAFLEGRNSVLPEDIQSLFVSVVNHRISSSTSTYEISSKLAEEIIGAVAID